MTIKKYLLLWQIDIHQSIAKEIRKIVREREHSGFQRRHCLRTSKTSLQFFPRLPLIMAHY